MFPVNLGDQLQVAVMIPSATLAATANGTGIDIQQYEGECAILLNSAAGTGNADNTMVVSVEDSPDNSTYTAVSGAVFATVSTAASVQKLSLNTDNVARYIRLVKTLAGTTPSFIAGAVFVGIKKNPA